ncbi:hypothetical protein C5Q97_07160 [Victivallales bacterium CCUG 44730]|nr:hypothetical protein C5Q97_07160 [Victivallales bacterium CCUG 44730]
MKSAATFQRRMQVSSVSPPPGKSAFGASGQFRGRASQAPRLRNPPGPRALPPTDGKPPVIMEISTQYF